MNDLYMCHDFFLGGGYSQGTLVTAKSSGIEWKAHKSFTVMNVYICVYIYVYIYMYVCMCVCVRESVRVRVWSSGGTQILDGDECICMHIYICIYIYMYVYVCLCVRECVRVRVWSSGRHTTPSR